MNYEEKYKEALEKLRAFHRDYKNISHLVDVKEELESIFPELKESEDERIRKEIIQSIQDNMCVIHKDKCLAWLEKQVPINEEAEKEKNDYVSGQFLYCKGSFNEFKEGESYWIEYIGNDTYIGRSDNILNQKFHITPRQLYTWLDPRHPEKQNEQKPAEWSEDDEEKLRDVIRLVEQGSPVRPIRDHYTDWLKSLKDRFQLQPKQEWSEEDEKMIEDIIEAIDTQYTVSNYSEMASWLNSLKPNHWKPSKEQISMLLAVLNDSNNITSESVYIALKSLYNDLKKL